MSEETKYVTVPCRVPAGLLKEGETLEWRCARYDDAWLCSDGSRYVCKDKERDYNVPVIVPRFDANAWAAKNLPKPACEREIWAQCRSDLNRQRWYWTSSCPSTTLYEITEQIGNEKFALHKEQSLFKWCRHVPPYDEDNGHQPKAEWMWEWHGGKQ